MTDTYARSQSKLPAQVFIEPKDDRWYVTIRRGKQLLDTSDPFDTYAEALSHARDTGRKLGLKVREGQGGS